MSNILYLLRGLPGSGKSTSVQKFINMIDYISFMICSADDWFVDDEGRYVFDTSKLFAAHKYCKTAARKAMSLQLDFVVVDNTNTTWSEMKDYVKYAIKYNYDIVLVEPKTSWKFDVDILTEKNSHGVPRETIKKMLDRWQTSAKIIESHPELRISYAEL